MCIKDWHLRLAHRTLPLWWWLSFCPHLIAAALTCGLFLEYPALEAYCSPRSGTLQSSSCLTFVLAFSFYFYSILKEFFLSGGHWSLLLRAGFPRCGRQLLLLAGFSGCGARALGAGLRGCSARAPALRLTGFAGPWCVESSCSRDWTCVPRPWWVDLRPLYYQRRPWHLLRDIFVFVSLPCLSSDSPHS